METGSNDGQFIFDPRILEKLTIWAEVRDQLADRGLSTRPLSLQDYDGGYIELLAQLTEVGDIDREQFNTRFEQMRAINSAGEHYVIVVVVDKSSKKVVGASTLLLEYKFIHRCATRGRLEDVVVSNSHRGQHIGELLVRIIVELARESFQCYKLSLDCTESLKQFYAKNNFVDGSNMMVIRFE